MRTVFSLFLILLSLSLFSEPFAYFVPPASWKMADPSKLSDHVKVGFFSPSRKVYVPSINLAIEEVHVDLKTYVDVVKEHFQRDQTAQYRSLGTLKTAAGTGHLATIVMSEAGVKLQMLQCIHVMGDYAYIMTGVAPREDFSKVRTELLKTMRTFQIEEPPTFDPEKDAEWKRVLTAWENLAEDRNFHEKTFQKKTWLPFEAHLKKTYADKGLYWQVLCANHLKEELLKVE